MGGNPETLDDGIPAWYDLDADNDGILDLSEGTSDRNVNGKPAYLDTSEDVYSQLLQVILDAPTPPLPGTPPDAKVRSSATGVYTFPSGALTNSRPIRLHGRLQITEEDGELILRSRRGAWRNGIRLLPVDASDPFFLALDTASVVKPKIALLLDSGGQISGLRLDRLTLMERDDTLSPWA